MIVLPITVILVLFAALPGLDRTTRYTLVGIALAIVITLEVLTP